MTVEFYTRSHVFSHAQDAIRTVMGDKRALKTMIEKQGKLSETAYTSVIDDFLALAIQFEIYPTKEFEHYPRLARDYAKELLFLMSNDFSPEIQIDYVNSYIENYKEHKFHEVIR